MEKTSLRRLFAESIFRVPDYQRGYAWELKQWDDFIEDVDALVDNEVGSHYTGTIVTFQDRAAPPLSYGRQRIQASDIVDGQQRLTTTCLYLACILRRLLHWGKTDYQGDIEHFLYSGPHCRVTLGNSTADLFHSLLKSGQADAPTNSLHANRLVNACGHFEAHLAQQLERRGKDGVGYLENLFDAITRKLAFTSYTLDEECEIGMTFELMNSRGAPLSVLELLKNYLMHWVARNAPTSERGSLTATINRTWKTVYVNVGRSHGDEDQCLRVAWTLLCSHTPANWIGYSGFKQAPYIPLRNFPESREKVQVFLLAFTEGLSEISKYYADVIAPAPVTELSPEETEFLTKLRNAGNIANFLPLLVAARKQVQHGKESLAGYLELLRAIECYSYRVFLYNRRRSNAGKSSFYRWGSEVFRDKRALAEIAKSVHALIRYYAPESEFIAGNSTPDDWYSVRHLLRYTLFEYELHLLKEEGKGKTPHLRWEDLSDSTLEHILPQNPAEGSAWLTDWSVADRSITLHDIGNLVLTENNSNYGNRDFDIKRGLPGISPSYADSDIRQERRLAKNQRWTRVELDARRAELTEWMNNRWATVGSEEAPEDDVNEDSDTETTTI